MERRLQLDPEGWDKHPMRYRIGGDASLEYVKCDGGIHQQVRYAIMVVAGQDHDVVTMIDRSEILGKSFPSGSWFFKVLTIQAQYNVYCYHNHCVVVAEEDMKNVSVGTIIKRLVKE